LLLLLLLLLGALTMTSPTFMPRVRIVESHDRRSRQAVQCNTLSAAHLRDSFGWQLLADDIANEAGHSCLQACPQRLHQLE